MARKIEHKDLFYRKPPPTYRGNAPRGSGSRRHRRQRSPIGPFIIALLAVVLAIFLITKFFKSDGRKSTPESSAPITDENGMSLVIEENESAPPPESSEAEQPVFPDDYDDLTPAAEPAVESSELFNTMMIVNDRGFRYFSFSEDSSISFIEEMKTAKNKMGLNTNFSVMILPDATDIVLPQSFLADVPNTSDQQKALDYLNSSINAVAPGINTLNPYGILKANCDKDIFFKTDRSWTALGAYYAYRLIANNFGFDPVPLTDFTETSYDGFTGSMYSQSNYNEKLGYTEPVVTYSPPANITAAYDDYGSMTETPLIADGANYESEYKYNVFLGGDYSYMEIKNNDLADGSQLILVKDSMANPIVPFLACNYETIYVVDYPSYTGSLPELVSRTGCTNVLLMCRISATSEPYDISAMQNIM